MSFYGQGLLLSLTPLIQVSMDIEHVRSRFIKHFDGKTGNIYASPGRINLIGEHTDYNGGFVFPGAIDKGIMAEVRPNGLQTIMCYSIDLKDRVEFKVDDPVGPRASWARYIYGIVQEMRKLGVDVKGFNTAFAGDVPLGAGMSSSAALESCFAFALNDLFGDNKISKWDMVLAGQATEHNYCGVMCGIMDQFAVGLGKKDNAILLDCNTLKYEYVPVKLVNMSIVIVNTNKKRGLADSKYNERRTSCEEAVKVLNNNGVNIKYLGELTVTEFEKVKHYITDEEQLKRATHAVTENERAKIAVEFLKKDDIAEFGKLMNKSHTSLRDDYEVTGLELDSLVEAAWEEKGTVGSRMTGAGFGGCTVSIVENDYVDSFIKNVGKKYKEKTGLEASFYIANIGDGAGKVK